MARPIKMENLFNSKEKIKDGYVDNSRENIDPHIRTKVLDTKEIIQKGVSYDLSTIGGADTTQISAATLLLFTEDIQLSGATIILFDNVVALSGADLVLTDGISALSGADIVLTNEVNAASGATLVIPSISGATILNQSEITQLSSSTLFLNSEINQISSATLILFDGISALSGADLKFTDGVNALSGADLYLTDGINVLSGADVILSGATIINKEEITQISAATLLPSAGGDLTVLGAGSITTLSTTTAYGTNYEDINIGLGELGVNDLIVVEFGMHKTGATGTHFTLVSLVNTTTQCNAIAVQSASGNQMSGKVTIIQDKEINDYVVMTMESRINTTYSMSVDVQDSDDANVFATAFTVRINTKFDVTATKNEVINYIVYVIKG